MKEETPSGVFFARKLTEAEGVILARKLTEV